MNRNEWMISAFGGVLLLAAGVVSADDMSRQERIAQKLNDRFAMADANGDGLLTEAEAQGKMRFVHRHFAEIDTAKQGAITLDQIKDYVAQQAVARGMGS